MEVSISAEIWFTEGVWNIALLLLCPVFSKFGSIGCGTCFGVRSAKLRSRSSRNEKFICILDTPMPHERLCLRLAARRNLFNQTCSNRLFSQSAAAQRSGTQLTCRSCAKNPTLASLAMYPLGDLYDLTANTIVLPL